LLQQLIAGLQQLPGLRLFGPLDPDRQGSVLSFTLDGRDPAAIAFYLDQDHLINARAGLHCAPDAHRTIGTFPHGTVRVSPGFFTTAEDIDLLIRALADLASRAA
jgi:selenocysteine lyase/cysteine desulfurase